MRSWIIASLCPLLLVAGCRSGSDAAPATGDPPVIHAAEHINSDVYHPGPVGIDDDSDFDPPDPFTEALLYPLREIGGIFKDLIAVPVNAMKTASGDTPRKAVNLMMDKKSADNRREGIDRLLEYPYTRRPPYTGAYEALARADDDPTVRAAALRACSRSRDRKAVPLFIKSLSDRDDMVRLEAVKGLANVPDPAAVAPLLTLVNNPDANRDVRIAAVDALRYYRTLEVARALSSLLSDGDFSVAWQARRSLVYLTHRDFGYEEGAWLGYLAGPEKPLG
jgi:hypothetical protein